MWERFIQDLRQGARTLAKSRGFTAIELATLALGLGINTGVVGIVNAVMLRALPYQQPDRPVSLWETFDGSRSAVAPGNRLAASFVPALRRSRVDAVVALRAE